MKSITALKSIVEPWEALDRDAAELLELSELASDDASMMAELAEQTGEVLARLDSLEATALMSEPDDHLDCYLHVHAGAGGTESCDWANMLLRMYVRWCERSGAKVETVEISEGEEAGIRSATILIKAPGANGRLKGESGIHRLVRISPFDAASRRHTSFSSIDVWPDVDDNIEIEIRDEDLRVDTYRASGAGGQHVNKTDSAVRMTHIPTNIVVQCQNERSQHKNRATALKMMRSKLYQHFLRIQREEQAAKAGEKMAIGWGSQIRSYVFQPYTMVKDTRTRHQTGNVQAVMDGDLDGFLQATLKWKAGLLNVSEIADDNDDDLGDE